MDIYIVQPNDTIDDIARKYGVSVIKLIRDNELENPEELVPGQTIVIVYPEQIYTVQEGDTLESIAKEYEISVMQLLRNNPFLSNRSPVPDEVITISYNTTGKIITNGFAYPYINKDILKKTLPFLTYISIYNYRNVKEGGIISYLDDSEIISIAKEYGTIPLMMLTTLSPQGEADIEVAYSTLLTIEYQDNIINNMINIMKQKGYNGINFVFHFLELSTQNLVFQFIKRIYSRLKSEGYLFFVTFNPNTRYVDNEVTFKNIDYSIIRDFVDGITFLQFIFGINYGPPAPANSIYVIRTFLNYALTLLPPDMISIGSSLISYDYRLPYIPGTSYANSLSINTTLSLARDVNAIIQFDNISKSPFFYYSRMTLLESTQHIVWTIDARTIDAIVKLIHEFLLNGGTFWNLMFYYPQLWIIINSQMEIVKFLP